MQKKIYFAFKENSKWKKICLFLGIIYLSFLLLDFFFPQEAQLSSGLKLLSIGLLFLAQFFYGKDRTGFWEGAAGLTVIADRYLLFSNIYEKGVFCFVWVHFLRLMSREQCKQEDTFFYLGLLAHVLFFILQFFLPKLLSLVIVYCILLFLNTIEAFLAKNKKLILAYLLFWACDICVGLANGVGPFHVARLSRKLIWLFYLPSQTLLADYIMEPMAAYWKRPGADKGHNE